MVRSRWTTGGLGLVALLGLGAGGCEVDDLPEELRSLFEDASPKELKPESGDLKDKPTRRRRTAQADAGTPTTPDAGDDGRNRRRSLPNVEFSALHQSATVVDMHVDGLWFTRSRDLHFSDWGDKRQAHPHQIRNGHVDAVFFSIWVPPDKGNPPAEARALVEKFKKEALARTDMRPAVKPEEIEANANERRVTALLGLEGCAALDGKPENVDWFIDQGVRYVSLTWNEKNPFASGAKGGDTGLSSLGRALVERLNRRGVMVDVSHASRQTFWDIATLTRAPFIATHSNTRALCDHPRNLDDLQLYAVREAGGVVGLNFYTSFLVKTGKATVADVVAHALRMKAIMGADHIGIGSDFDGDIEPPTDLRDISWMSRLTQRLLQDDFTEEEVVAVLGGNLIRVMHEVQSGAMERRVEHRPARLKNLGDDALTDANFSTTWSPEQPGALVQLEVREPGLDRLTIWTSTPFGHSGVKKLTVRTSCGTGCGGTTTVTVDGAPRPIRVELAGVARAKKVTVEVVVEAFNGNGRIAEIVPEIHVAP